MITIILYFAIYTIRNTASICPFSSGNINLTTFIIYNRNLVSGTALTKGTIIPSTDIFVLAHGWLYDSQTEWIVESRPNLLRLYPNANVIIIDYSPYSNNPFYLPDVCTSQYVGQAAADMLISLNVDAHLVSCTGHSMGAHVCGALGRRFSQIKNQQIARITGLDTAGPGYDPTNNLLPLPLAASLSKSDAKRIVGIYTDSAGWGFGMNQKSSYSHISIIINAGFNQPSCDVNLLCPLVTIFSLGQMPLLQCVFCSHQFSRIVYRLAMTGRTYILTKCDDYNAYEAGTCNGNPTFVYTEKLDPTIADGIYRIQINANYNQISKKA